MHLGGQKRKSVNLEMDPPMEKSGGPPMPRGEGVATKTKGPAGPGPGAGALPLRNGGPAARAAARVQHNGGARRPVRRAHWGGHGERSYYMLLFNS